MTTYTPTFNVEDYELRNYTSPYLTLKQTTEVTQVEERVQGQLDFLAQMLGWNGPNYWVTCLRQLTKRGSCWVELLAFITHI